MSVEEAKAGSVPRNSTGPQIGRQAPRPLQEPQASGRMGAVQEAPRRLLFSFKLEKAPILALLL